MRYSQGFKASIIKKLQDGSGRSVYSLARETGINAATIKSWLAKAKNGILNTGQNCELTPSQRSLGEKLSLLLESQKISEEDKGEWLRVHGLHSEHIPLWEQELVSIMSNKEGDLKAELEDLKRINKKLKRENERQQKALAEAAILITLKKNYPNLFEDDGDDWLQRQKEGKY